MAENILQGRAEFREYINAESDGRHVNMFSASQSENSQWNRTCGSMYDITVDFTMYNKPYTDYGEYIADRLSLLNMRILLYNALNDAGLADLDAAPDKDELFEQLRETKPYITYRESLVPYSDDALPLLRVVRAFSLDEFETHVLVCALAPELDLSYAKIFTQMNKNGQPGVHLPLIDSAITLYCDQRINRRALISRFVGENSPFTQLFARQGFAGKLSNLAMPLKLDTQVLSFLLHKEQILPGGMQLVLPDDTTAPDLWCNQELTQKIQDAVDMDSVNVVNIWGSKGTGKKLHVSHLCRVLGRKVIFVEAEQCLTRAGEGESALSADKAFNEARLRDAYLCVYHIKEEEFVKDSEIFNKYLDKNRAYGFILFLLSDKELRMSFQRTDVRFVTLEAEIPSAEARREIWSKIVQNRAVGPEGLNRLTNAFQFSVGQMKSAYQSAELHAKWAQSIITERLLFDACHKQISENFGKNAVLLKNLYTWEQLILPPPQKQLLKDACDRLKNMHVVFNQWGYDKIVAYGKALSLVFYGQSGTGKTMAAQVVANTLKLPIYRIELSSVVSKYIGETEKNLKEIFDASRKSSVILFFDEADALFGKRSEVKDSHDRYANAETAFLLQEIESCTGIVILATNLITNFDDAFKRRFTYIIDFPFPDKYAREQIWRTVLPETLPMAEDMDISFLAEQFELSGATIKNVALNAAFLAAEEGVPMNMRHIINSIKTEYMKNNRTLDKHDLGRRSYYLQ